MRELPQKVPPGILDGSGDAVKLEKQIDNTGDWLDRLARKRLLTKDFRK